MNSTGLIDFISSTAWVGPLGRHQKRTLLWIFYEAEADEVDHTQIICTSIQTDKHFSTSSLNFYGLDAISNAQTTMSASCLRGRKRFKTGGGVA